MICSYKLWVSYPNNSEPAEAISAYTFTSGPFYYYLIKRECVIAQAVDVGIEWGGGGDHSGRAV
jgi:hypothetical protein